MPAETNIERRSPAYHHPPPPVMSTTPKSSSYSKGFSPQVPPETNIQNSRLLQLAERSSNPRKNSPSSHLLSFRNAISPKSNKSSPNPPPPCPSSQFSRRNTSVLNSSSPGLAEKSQEHRQNPKLYTSFSTKSCSKLTKAFIKSDPLKTNIEHLVSPPTSVKSPPSSPSENSPNSSDTKAGLTTLITPLKALHASFHDRSKLSSAFAAPRTRLFSQRGNNNNNNKKDKASPVVAPPGNNRDKSPDFLEYFGDNVSTPDILEDCLAVGVDSESNYIILEKRAGRPPRGGGVESSEELINNNCANYFSNGYLEDNSLEPSSPPVNNSNYVHPPTKSKSPIKSGTNPVQISRRTRESAGNLHSNKYCKDKKMQQKDTEGMIIKGPKMSTATPMKISSSSACRAQIITLMARSNVNGGGLCDSSQDNNTHLSSRNHDHNNYSNGLKPPCDGETAGVAHLNSFKSKEKDELLLKKSVSKPQIPQRRHSTQPTPPSGQCSIMEETGSVNSIWTNSCKNPPPPIPKRSSAPPPVAKIEMESSRGIIPLKSFNDSIKSNSNLGRIRTGYVGEHDDEDECIIQYRNYHHKTSNTTGPETDMLIDRRPSLNNEKCDNNYPQQQHQLPIIMSRRKVGVAKNMNDGQDAKELNININYANNNATRKPSLPSRSARLRNKCRPNLLMHSLSLRSSKAKSGCVGYSTLENSDSIHDLIEECNRNRSRSLPKSFMSGKGFKRPSVLLPSFWSREDTLFERLEEKRTPESESPSGSSTQSDELDLSKMRWQKAAAASSNSSSSSTGAEGHGRPKSFDYSQRKAWMKYYREMEINAATNNTSNSTNATSSKKGISKGSISHLHLLESTEKDLTESKKIHGHPNPPEVGMVRRTDTGTHPSLFQRFSKTFSLRFGSSSSVNKVNGVKNGKQIQGPLGIGSSPDLHNRFTDVQSGKMRKEKSKSIRGEKCQSGDSGISIDDPHSSNGSRLRRIRSEYIEPSTFDHKSYSSRNSEGVSTSALPKMSLVEIPDHIWEEEKAKRRQRHSGYVVDPPNLTSSYEDILESKLDEDDDGFSSGEDSRNGTCVDTGLSRKENPAYHPPSSHYHSLPHKNSKKNKNPQSTNQPTTSLTPSGRSRSLEDEQELEEPVEDNSIRGKVVREMILTEQNYVKTLNDIVQGFLNPCRARKDLFSLEIIRNIFSNIEDILRIHARFLEAMKKRINHNSISSSNIGKIFTEWADHFDLYSEYCCNNPISVATVQSLMQSSEYAEFFEACRRLQLMDKLPLHGFLLRPIQRICQYHLQLTELMKQTEESHQDYSSVVEAVETMKAVAMKINDTQKQFDSLQEIIRLQNSIEGWEGSDLLSRNSTVMIKGELVKTALGKRNKEIFCILLNKDLIFCKKDYIRKVGYVFEGRIDLEVGVWLNIDSNEEDDFFGMVHNSWRIFSQDLNTWILFTAPSPTEKRKWITALEKTVEVKPADKKICEMAKLTTLLSEERPQSTHFSSSSNTLPKSKKSKGKHSVSNGKIDADAMLIEVSKLKRPNYCVGVQPNPLVKDRASKFYV